MATMKAVRLHVPSRQLRLEEIVKPVAGAGEVLVKVEAAGVCLSDVHLISGVLGAPPYLEGDTVTLGHEVSGSIAHIGPGVTGWAVGDRVTLLAGEERDGRLYTEGVDYDGGWAEYVLARTQALVRLPDSISFEQGAIIPDAVSTPWSAIVDTAQVRPGQTVAVWGIGGLGAHGVQLLRAVGACPIIAVDPVATARERALAFGADYALDSVDPDFVEKMRACTGGTGPEVAFDFAGVAPVREQALSVLAPEGVLVLVGLSGKPITIAESTRFVASKQQIRGHYGTVPTAVPQLIELVERGRLDFSRSISAILPLEDAADAVRQLQEKKGDPIRLILRP